MNSGDVLTECVQEVWSSTMQGKCDRVEHIHVNEKTRRFSQKKSRLSK